MGRWKLGVMVMVAISCGGGGGPYVIEVLDEQVARVQTEDGRERTVKRAELPTGAREGDVVVDGRLDPELRARNLQRVQTARAALDVKRASRIDLDAPAQRNGRLTADPE